METIDLVQLTKAGHRYDATITSETPQDAQARRSEEAAVAAQKKHFAKPEKQGRTRRKSGSEAMGLFHAYPVSSHWQVLFPLTSRHARRCKVKRRLLAQLQCQYQEDFGMH